MHTVGIPQTRGFLAALLPTSMSDPSGGIVLLIYWYLLEAIWTHHQKCPLRIPLLSPTILMVLIGTTDHTCCRRKNQAMAIQAPLPCASGHPKREPKGLYPEPLHHCASRWCFSKSVPWDDYSIPNWMESHIPVMFQTTNQCPSGPLQFPTYPNNVWA